MGDSMDIQPIKVGLSDPNHCYHQILSGQRYTRRADIPCFLYMLTTSTIQRYVLFFNLPNFLS